MTIGIYSTRALSGNLNKNLIQQMRTLETRKESIELITNGKTDQGAKSVNSISGLNVSAVFPYFNWYHSSVKNMIDWEEAYSKIDLEPLKKYSSLYLYGGLLSERSGIQRNGGKASEFPVNRQQINYISVGSEMLHVLALLKANHELGIPLHEIIHDPQECSLNLINEKYCPKDNYWLYHGYDIPRYNVHRLDSFQYWLKESESPFDDYSNKLFDLTFGYTTITKDREGYTDFVNNFTQKFNKINLFTINKSLGINTFVDREIYLDLIGKSKYTIILPAYDNTCMSVYRILESISRDCLPLLHPACNRSELEVSYDIDLFQLIINDDWRPFSEKERFDIIQFLKQKMLGVVREFKTNLG